MKTLTRIIYDIKMVLLTIHFYFIFSILHNILDMKIWGYLFLGIYTIYIIKIIGELLSQKKRYKNDFIYNLMQIGILAYIIFFAIKVNINGIYVTNMTYNYFKSNYIVVSALFIFVFIYSLAELCPKK